MNGKQNNLIDSIDISSAYDKLTLIVTKGCNLSCDYCFEKHYPEQKMGIETAVNAIESYETRIVKFFGGEPMSNRGLIRDIIDRYPDKEYQITTNGIYLHKLDPNYWDKFTSVNVSLDGLYEYDSVRWSTKIEYDLVRKNILWLKDVRPSIPVILNITVSEDSMNNRSILERMIDLNNEFRIDLFEINIVVIDSDGNICLTEEGRSEFIKQSLEAYLYSIEHGGAFDITMNEAVFSSEDSGYSCCAWKAKSQMAVDVDGYATHCHVASYFKMSDSTLREVEKTSSASCLTLDVLVRRSTGIPLKVDTENFKYITQAEKINYGIRSTGRDLPKS